MFTILATSAVAHAEYVKGEQKEIKEGMVTTMSVEQPKKELNTEEKQEVKNLKNTEEKREIEQTKKEESVFSLEEAKKQRALAQNQMEEYKEKGDEETKERVREREAAINKFDKTLSIIKNAKEKIEDQLPKLERFEIEIEDVENKLAIVGENILKTEEKITNIHIILSSNKELTEEEKGVLLELAKEAQATTEESKEILIEIIKNLKEKVSQIKAEG